MLFSVTVIFIVNILGMLYNYHGHYIICNMDWKLSRFHMTITLISLHGENGMQNGSRICMNKDS